MACGTPVLITHDTAKGAPGVEAVALTAEATIDSLSQVIQSVVHCPEQLRERRQTVARYAEEQWSWQRCGEQYLERFHQLVKRADVVRSAIDD
jgi:glycosyltransferase involved in cell wall biosynthesis